MGLNIISKELMKIAKGLIAADWQGKIVGPDFRARWNYTRVLVEQLHAKGRKQLRNFAVDIWSGGYFTILNSRNLVEDIRPEMSYEQVKNKVIENVKKFQDLEFTKYENSDPEKRDSIYKYGVRMNENQISSLKVEPEGMDKMEILAEDFTVVSEWTKFGAYSPKSDLQSSDPSYTKIVSLSTGAARKFYKMAKINPDLLKGVSFDEFTGWLKKNGIGYDMNFSQWH